MSCLLTALAVWLGASLLLVLGMLWAGWRHPAEPGFYDLTEDQTT